MCNKNIHILKTRWKYHNLKKTELKSCHNTNWEDDYSWVHQPNILEVLKDSSKLDPEVRKYLEEENNYTKHHLKDTKGIQKTLFDEIKGGIKLDDEFIPVKIEIMNTGQGRLQKEIIRLNWKKLERI